MINGQFIRKKNSNHGSVTKFMKEITDKIKERNSQIHHHRWRFKQLSQKLVEQPNKKSVRV